MTSNKTEIKARVSIPGKLNYLKYYITIKYIVLIRINETNSLFLCKKILGGAVA